MLLAARSLAAQEQFVERADFHLHPGRAAVVALVGAFGAFHLAQQGVHFLRRQDAVGAHRRVAASVPSSSLRRSISTREPPYSRTSRSTSRASVCASAFFSSTGTERTASVVGDSAAMSKPNASKVSWCSCAVPTSMASA